MKIKGFITHVGEERSGVSKSSGKAWRSKQYIVTYADWNTEWPKSVVFDAMNERIDESNLELNKEYELDIDFYSDLYNGRYYLRARLYKARLLEQSQPMIAMPQPNQPMIAPPQQTFIPMPPLAEQQPMPNDLPV